MGQNDHVEQAGKHAGKRGADPRTRGNGCRPALAYAAPPLALGVTLSVVAWGYLVYAAIDFGAGARSGEDGSWWLLGLASVGAVACLFVGLLLVARLLRMLGVLKSETPKPPRPAGGKRAAR